MVPEKPVSGKLSSSLLERLRTDAAEFPELGGQQHFHVEPRQHGPDAAPTFATTRKLVFCLPERSALALRIDFWCEEFAVCEKSKGEADSSPPAASRDDKNWRFPQPAM